MSSRSASRRSRAKKHRARTEHYRGTHRARCATCRKRFSFTPVKGTRHREGFTVDCPACFLERTA